jgi:hypothetical protein
MAPRIGARPDAIINLTACPVAWSRRGTRRPTMMTTLVYVRAKPTPSSAPSKETRTASSARDQIMNTRM